MIAEAKRVGRSQIPVQCRSPEVAALRLPYGCGDRGVIVRELSIPGQCDGRIAAHLRKLDSVTAVPQSQ